MRRYLLARPVLAAAIVVLAILAISGAAVVGNSQISSRPNLGIFATEASLSAADLVQNSELVVVGTAGSDQVLPFTANPLVPSGERDPRIYAQGSYHDVTFNVIEYLKGQGSSTLSIRRFASTPAMSVDGAEMPVLATGRQYVLFLERGQSIWTGGWIMLGSRGAGAVRGTGVELPALGRIELRELRSLAQRFPNPPNWKR